MSSAGAFPGQAHGRHLSGRLRTDFDSQPTTDDLQPTTDQGQGMKRPSPPLFRQYNQIVGFLRIKWCPPIISPELEIAESCRAEHLR